MFTLPSARWLLCFSSSSGCSKMREGRLVVALQSDPLAARAIQPNCDTLRSPWCGIAFSWNCHRQGESALRVSSYEDRVASLVCRFVRVARLAESVVDRKVSDIFLHLTCGAPSL